MINQQVVIIGSGNVATHFAKSLIKGGHHISQVYSRQMQHAFELARTVSAQAIDNLKNISSKADIYLICVSDKGISEVAGQLSFVPKLIAHTSGSIGIEVLNKFPDYGVFYPLQTISKNRSVNLTESPICIEANNGNNREKLTQLAYCLSNNINYLNSEERKQCHLAAVFANNFVNHFYALACDILQKKNLDFNLLKPLILETAQKIQETEPTEAQTGPAIRNDQNVIEEHLRLLASPKLENLYRFVSMSITEHAQHKLNNKNE